VGLAIAAAVWLGACYVWRETRIWFPLYDVPIYLDQPHTQTPEFGVNLEGSYRIEVGPNQQYDYYSSDPSQEWQWSVSSGEHIVARGSRVPVNGWLGTFFARKGRYVLNLTPGRGAMAPARVSVGAALGEYSAAELKVNRAFQLFLVIIAAYVYFAVRAAVERRRDRLEAEARAYPLTQPGTFGPAPSVDPTIRRPWKLRESRRQPAFARLSWIGLVMSTTWLVVLTSFSVWHFSFPDPAVGLPVRLLRPGAQREHVGDLHPLLVRVACSEGDGCASPILYLNSQPIAWDQLGPLLDKQLLLRPPVWPVYVQGDASLDWGSVALAVDIIEGKGAQVILLTDWVAATQEPVR
jgi:hypothetical protein